jgi:hypothetical protein
MCSEKVTFADDDDDLVSDGPTACARLVIPETTRSATTSARTGSVRIILLSSKQTRAIERSFGSVSQSRFFGPVLRDSPLRIRDRPALDRPVGFVMESVFVPARREWLLALQVKGDDPGLHVQSQPVDDSGVGTDPQLNGARAWIAVGPSPSQNVLAANVAVRQFFRAEPLQAVAVQEELQQSAQVEKRQLFRWLFRLGIGGHFALREDPAQQGTKETFRMV